MLPHFSASCSRCSAVQSGRLRMEIGVLYLSYAILVPAELIVCSTRGFACILAKWFWPAVMSLSLTYGSPEASCNKQVDTYFGRQSASLMKEFWTLCIFVITVSETVMVETISYSNIGLTDCLQICKMVAGLGLHFLLTNILKRSNFRLQYSKISSKCFLKVILLSKVIPENFM